MSINPNPHVEQKLSEYFRTISADVFQFWMMPEVTRLLFFTDHYFTRNKGNRDNINISTDDVLRELQVEIRTPTSLALKVASMIFQALKIRMECPTCKNLEADLIKHLEEKHPLMVKKNEPSQVQNVQ